MLLKCNNTTIVINNPKTIYIRDGQLIVITKEGNEYRGNLVSYE